MPKKALKPLTEAEQRLAEEMWRYVERYVYKVAERMPLIDFHGAVAERLCRAAKRYNPGLGVSIKAYAYNHARFACADEARQNKAKGTRRRKRGTHPETMQLKTYNEVSSTDDLQVRGDHMSYLSIIDPESGAEVNDEINHILRGFSARTKAIVKGHIVDGRTLKELGTEAGISESRASQITSNAMNLLRKRNMVT